MAAGNGVDEQEGLEELLATPPITTTGDDDGVLQQLFGKRRTFVGLDGKEWAFLVVAVISVLVAVGLTTYRLVVVILDDPESSDFTFTILIILNSVFCIYYVIHGLLKECDFEIYAYMAATILILCYVIMEYVIDFSNRTIIKDVRLVAGCILAPVNMVLGYAVAKEFGWLEFRIVGASEMLQYIYREAIRFTCALKLDFQVVLSLIALAFWGGIKLTTSEIIILAVGIPYSIIWMSLGYMLIRKESRPLVYVFGVLGIIAPGFVGYKLYMVYTHIAVNINDLEDKEMLTDGRALVYAELVACAISLVMRGVVFIELYRIVKNFGKGLREKAFHPEMSERSSLLYSKPRC